MVSQSISSAAGQPGANGAKGDLAFELKAAAFTLPVIRLLCLDMDAVEAQLAPKVEQAPGFFRNTPVVIDLGELSASDADVGFPQLVGLLRGLGMIPVGVRGGSAGQNEAAQAMELAILGDSVKPKRAEAAAAEPSKAARANSAAGAKAQPIVAAQTDAPVIGVDTGSTLIGRPVRSGQRVYAAGGDLTVIGAVSSGAELMADGNIHVYAPLRGRVMAGLKGNEGARIFCQDLQAELISIAGHYRVSENIPAELKGRRVQVFLDHAVLRIEPL
ncbi:MAG: septum site-determining protein MinC [Thiohalocapsa sp.]|nr:septum site-determining protein MinC [Thiohalocapsa sp.]